MTRECRPFPSSEHGDCQEGKSSDKRRKKKRTDSRYL